MVNHGKIPFWNSIDGEYEKVYVLNFGSYESWTNCVLCPREYEAVAATC
uniref:Uncharacterized protein n=1 Tax=Triticum urartu TaxID=4572 RepID=A0A8R7JUM8_TRIUA